MLSILLWLVIFGVTAMLAACGAWYFFDFLITIMIFGMVIKLFLGLFKKRD